MNKLAVINGDHRKSPITERMQQVIKVSQESVLTAREVVQEAKKTRAKALELRSRRLKKKL